jgi:hypothetical protein
MLLASERELQKSVALNIGAGVSSPASLCSDKLSRE